MKSFVYDLNDSCMKGYLFPFSIESERGQVCFRVRQATSHCHIHLSISNPNGEGFHAAEIELDEAQLLKFAEFLERAVKSLHRVEGPFLPERVFSVGFKAEERPTAVA